jgi:hypothetical protein
MSGLERKVGVIATRHVTGANLHEIQPPTDDPSDSTPPVIGFATCADQVEEVWI